MMKDKKILTLLFLIFIWVFFFFRGSTETQTHSPMPSRAPRRSPSSREEPALHLDSDRYLRRLDISLDEGRNLFESPGRMNTSPFQEEKPKVSQRDLLLSEMRSTQFLGSVSSGGGRRIYLEYRGDLHEVGDGAFLEMRVQGTSHSVTVKFQGEDTLTLYEPQLDASLTLNI